jgi:hypothetical protein
MERNTGIMTSIPAVQWPAEWLPFDRPSLGVPRPPYIDPTGAFAGPQRMLG